MDYVHNVNFLFLSLLPSAALLGVHGSGCAWQGRGPVRQRAMARGVYAVGRCAWQGAHGWRGGACVAGDTATAAGCTHPTGMHSCIDISVHFIPNN